MRSDYGRSVHHNSRYFSDLISTVAVSRNRSNSQFCSDLNCLERIFMLRSWKCNQQLSWHHPTICLSQSVVISYQNHAMAKLSTLVLLDQLGSICHMLTPGKPFSRHAAAGTGDLCLSCDLCQESEVECNLVGRKRLLRKRICHWQIFLVDSWLLLEFKVCL